MFSPSETTMPDDHKYTPSKTKDPDNHQTHNMPVQASDGGQIQDLDDKLLVKIDTDYAASSIADSDLEGSWATVSSGDTGTSVLDDLASGDEEENDSLNGLSPLNTASAVHSESEFDAFSDSANESDDAQPADSKTYEYVTDQSWTDPEETTPSNSTRSTVPGSFSRGLANARTPKHSRSSTWTEAHLSKHSRKQLAAAQGQSIVQLSDSQVELVFPRIAADFGAESVETITSSTPLLPLTEQSNASSDTRPTQHNFRVDNQQLPEDDYVLLANSAVGSYSRSLVADNNVDSGAAAHHAFSTYPLDGRRGEKRERVEFFGDGIDQRGKRSFDSSIEPVADDEHPELCERQQDAKQEQFTEQLVGLPERVVDSDTDGYERLNATDAYCDSVDDSTDDLPWESAGAPSSLTARLIEIRTNCPVQRDWLDAVSEARIRGQIVIQAATNTTETARLTGIAPERDLTFDYMPLQQEISSKVESAVSQATAQESLEGASSRGSRPALYLQLPYHVMAL